MLLKRTSWELADWAERLAEIYCASVSEEDRSVALTPCPTDADADAYCRWKMKTTKQVQRFINGDVRIPVDLLPAWINALPQPYRSQCRADVSTHWNCLAVEIPEEGVTATDLGELIKQAGEEQVAAAPVFADGQVTAEDLPYLPEAIRNCEESAAASLAMRERLQRELWRLRSEEPAGPRLQPVGGKDKR